MTCEEGIALLADYLEDVLSPGLLGRSRST